MAKTPLAVFTYNRPTHTQQVLQHLAKCSRLNECDIIIFCDGLKEEAHRSRVNATRDVVQEWVKIFPAQIIEREHNLGLKKSIETGVNNLCQQYGRIIVLEDDLLVDPAFIDYMLQALDFYEYNERVMQVSGHSFLLDLRVPQSAILMPLSTTWGWATWARAWRYYNPDASTAYLSLQDPIKSYAFDLDGSYPYTQMLRNVVNRDLQSWGVLFWYAVWQNGGLVSYPRQSLVENIGFDGSGVNSGRASFFEKKSKSDEIVAIDWNFQDEADLLAFRQVCDLIRRNIAPQKPSFMHYIRRTLNYLIRQLEK